MEFLNKILVRQADILVQRKQITPQDTLLAKVADMPPTLGFAKALRNSSNTPEPRTSIIAEMKKASPSAGLIRQNYSAADLARSYADNGASCISVLTNEHFAGEDAHLLQVRERVSIPLLRKDFIIDAYQVYETRALGADALLLIVAALKDEELAELGSLGLQLGLDILFESHSLEEAQRSLVVTKQIFTQLSQISKLANESAEVILGVNSRDLHNFKINLPRAMEIISYLKQNCDHLVVAESGIKSPADINDFTKAGANGFLIGEVLMRADDPGAALDSFLSLTS
ncbi:MAG: indole-3-glycerol-phosphate synthase [Candidatus Portiera sp.]|nr:indole-3-glycerol-phosphate synthase [Portiera sp.]